MELCPCCGEEAAFDVVDVYLDTRELVLDACCEENLVGWIESIRQIERHERARWIADLTGLIVKDVLVTDDTSPLDFGLRARIRSDLVLRREGVYPITPSTL